MSDLYGLDELRDIVGQLCAHGTRNPVVLEQAHRTLSGLAEKVADLKSVYYVSSLLNLLLDVNYHSEIPDAVVSAFLRRMALDPSGKWMRKGSGCEQLLCGPESRCPTGDPLASTVLSLNTFAHFHGKWFGCSKFSPSERNRIWKMVLDGGLGVRISDIVLGGINHVVWIADHSRVSNWTATQAYDELGLDWDGVRNWEVSRPEYYRSRAVIITLPFIARSRAPGGVRVPTGIDAWGHMLWMPSSPHADAPWKGGWTVNPHTGHQACVEAVHGRLHARSLAESEAVLVSAIGEIAGAALGNRLQAVSRPVVQRQIKLLEALIRSRRAG